jgi:plasmid stabilization system protein ParE
MELKVFWTDFAKAELKVNFDNLKCIAGLKVAKNENSKIVLATLRLKNSPEIGQIEPNLRNRKNEFRYLVHQTYKIIYWVNSEKQQVEIIDIFDTRQNPTKLKRTK